MQNYQLARAGDRPVEFSGEKIAESTTKAARGPAENRWWDLALYRSDSGKYILHVDYYTQWEGEYARSEVFIDESPEALIDDLRMTGPSAMVIGYPVGPQYEERQARLEQVLRQAWDAAVAEIMAGLPEKI